MPKLFIHPQTEIALRATAGNMPHGLLISGQRGIGLTTLAQQLILLAHGSTKTQVIAPDEKNTISIDRVRELYQQTRSKRGKRVIIIKDVDRMTIAAQNAFLKLLEEPNEGLSFLLTSHAPTKLLSTVLSRVQHLSAQPITSQQSEKLLDTLNITDKSRRMQLLFIAKGLPAELTRLSEDEDYFTTKAQVVRDARELLQANDYEKLLLINKYTDREKSLQLLDAALQIIHLTMVQKPQESIALQLENFLHAEDRIRENGHVRTQLLQAITSK